MPLFDDKSGGLTRRLLILDFSMKIDKEKKIANMVDLLSMPLAKSTLLNLAIKGMNQIIKNNYELTESPIINKTMTDYYLETDNVRSFLKDHNIENKSSLGPINFRWWVKTKPCWQKFIRLSYEVLWL